MKCFLYIAKLFTSIGSILQTVWGWVAVVAATVINYFTGHEFSCVIILVAVIFDAVWGIWAAKKQGRYARSELMRDSCSKISAYAMVVIFTIAVEDLCGMNSELPADIVASMILVTELWSIAGNVLIVNPNIAFFRLLRPLLRGEIAKKLRISEEKVDEYLNQETAENK